MTEGQIDVEHLSATTAAVVLRGEHDVYTVPDASRAARRAAREGALRDHRSVADVVPRLVGARRDARRDRDGARSGQGRRGRARGPADRRGGAHLRGHGPRRRASDPSHPRPGARDARLAADRRERRPHPPRSRLRMPALPDAVGVARQALTGACEALGLGHGRRATCVSRSARPARTSSHTPTATATSRASSRLPCCSSRAS